MKTLYLVMNPEAGTLQGRRILADIISLFNRADYLVSAYMTEKRGDAEEFTRLHGGKPRRPMGNPLDSQRFRLDRSLPPL